MSLRRFLSLFAILAIFMLPVACGDSSTSGNTNDTENPDDTGDDDDVIGPCTGLVSCDLEGWVCEEDVLVTCAINADDCMVETREDCSIPNRGYCNTASVIDSCDILAADCGSDGTCPARQWCDGDVLHTCIEDDDGCASITAEETCTLSGKVCVESDDGADCIRTNTADVSAQIATVRSAIDDASSLPRSGDWDIGGAIVTYVKAPLGADAGGFFIQAEAAGPALFVVYDDSHYSVDVGDEVELSIYEVDSVQGRRTVTSLGFLDVFSYDNDISGWAQDVSDVDIITLADDYEFELIQITGTLTAPFASANSQFMDAQMDTAAITGSDDLRLRMPTDLQESLENTYGSLVGCKVDIGVTPLWHYLGRIQPQVFTEDEITVDCSSN